jgi:ATP-dependent DNA helicase RecQ
VDALGEQFAIEYVMLILTGKATPAVKMYRHEELDVFACGNDKDPHLWNSLIRQMLLEEILEKDIVEYGVLKITKKGHAFLKKPTSFKIVLNNLFEDANADDEDAAPAGEGAGAADEILLNQLKELRKTVAKEKKLPPFVIFLESSLEDMATMFPTSMTELEKISGVSKGKSLRYGKPFLDIITRYVEENDIVRPDDFVMKSVVNRNNNKIFIIQNVDKKMALETIAKNKELKIEELLEEMETIVASGTKLNLNYAIDEMVDEYEQEEIMDYFKSCETSSLQVAQEEMAESNFNWEQLKLMRIKFLCEYGN